MVVQHLEQKFREKRFSSCESVLDKPASGAAAAKGKSRVKEKETVEIPSNGRQKVNALEDMSVV